MFFISHIGIDLYFVDLAISMYSEAMARLQEQASTGARLNRASDDPSAAYQVLGLNSQQTSMENYIDNLSKMVNTLEISSTIIGNMACSVSSQARAEVWAGQIRVQQRENVPQIGES